MRSRRRDMVIQSCHGTERGFDLVRQKDGELSYEPDAAPEAPTPIAGLALFVDLDNAVCGQVPVSAIPAAIDAVIVDSRVFVRQGHAGFHEVRAMSGSMP
jgi:hypothetical protein